MAARGRNGRADRGNTPGSADAARSVAAPGAQTLRRYRPTFRRAARQTRRRRPRGVASLAVSRSLSLRLFRMVGLRVRLAAALATGPAARWRTAPGGADLYPC